MIAQRELFLDDLKVGRLIQPFQHTLDRGDFTYYFIYPRNRLRSPAFRRFRVWLLEQAELAAIASAQYETSTVATSPRE
jgi:LysR family glycine cleavage system transcriptional activator